jgi:hypothetical protein
MTGEDLKLLDGGGGVTEAFGVTIAHQAVGHGVPVAVLRVSSEGC